MNSTIPAMLLTKSRSRFAPWIILSSAGLLALGGWEAGMTERADPGSPPTGAGSPAVGPVPTKHYVTPRQLAESNQRAGQEAGGLQGTAHDGQVLHWEQLSQGRPVALVFVKDGCPCNVEFEPFFQRVEALYRGVVRFAAVIDADVEGARTYAEERHVPYPVLADPDQRLIKQFGAENGGYLALLDARGVVAGVWPGCSADAMGDLGRRIARLAGVEERRLDVSGMPGPLTTGCPFQ